MIILIWLTLQEDLKELKGLCVRSFVWDKEKLAYEIQTYGEFDHLADTKIIGGIINTTEK